MVIGVRSTNIRHGTKTGSRARFIRIEFSPDINPGANIRVLKKLFSNFKPDLIELQRGVRG